MPTILGTSKSNIRFALVLVSLFAGIFLVTGLASAEIVKVTIGNETGGQNKINDTFANTGDGGPDTISGEKLYLQVRDHPSNQTADSRTYIKVNFSSLGSITITNATLYLTEDDGQPLQDTASIILYNVSQQSMVNGFNEYTLTWNNQPCGSGDVFNASCNTTATVITTVNQEGGQFGWNVLWIAQSVQSSTRAFVVVLNNSNQLSNEVNFESKESNVSADKRPYLYLEFDNGTISPTIAETPFVWVNNSQSIFPNTTLNLFLNVSRINSTTINATQFIEGGVSLVNKYLSLSGGTLTGSLISQAIRPSSDNLYDLGTSSFRWANIWARNVNANVTGTNASFTGNVTASAFSGSLDCGRITGGSDSSYCVDSSGSSVQTTSCANGSCIVSVGTGDKVSIWAKGTINGTSAVQTIRLNVNGSTVDSVRTKQAATADMVPFSLIGLHTPSVSGNINVSVNRTAGTLGDVKILVQVVG